MASRSSKQGVAAAATKTPYARLPLGALRVFAAVAKRRSFSGAADVLNLTTAAVSMQVKALEDYLEVRLFLRNPQRVELTPEGERLAPFVERGLAELEQGFRVVKSERGGGVLVVSMLTSFLHRWLSPRLPFFLSAHPDIDLRLQCSVLLTDFARSEVHVAIRMGVGKWAGLHAEKIYDEWVLPVCAPALLAKHGRLEPGTTGTYPLLHSTSEPWEMWTEGFEYSLREEMWPARGAAFDDSVAILSAAMSGNGLVLARWNLVCEYVTSGQLVMAADVAIPYGYDCYFVCPPAYLEMQKVRVFRDWVMSLAAKCPQPPRTTGRPVRSA